MGIGRVVCVALPFALTVGSIICLLVAGLAGVADKNLYVFRANVTDLQFNPTSIDVDDVLSSRSLSIRGDIDWHSPSLLNKDTDDSGSSSSSSSSSNVTAADLGLGNLYDVSLWGYCVTKQDGDRTCKKPAYNWANNILNDTLEQFKTAADLADQDLVLPDTIETAMKGFATLTKWTEIAYIASMVCLGVELFFGIFATCSRAWGCVTFIINAVASVIVIAWAILSTVMATLVVGVIKSTAHWYGVKGNFNTAFLAWAWLGVAFALGAGFFWMFTICCCASSHHSSKRGGFRARSEGEKNVPTGSYQPLGEQHEMTPPFYSSGAQYGGNRKSVGPRSDMAYEPYSHNRV